MKKRLGTNRIYIENATIIDPYSHNQFASSILIEDGFIKKMGKQIETQPHMTHIDAKDYVVSPGFVDMHAHLRDPGEEQKEDIESGIKAALAGGFVAIACMPNTKPPIDRPALVKYILEQARKNDFTIICIAAMTKNLEGREISEMGLLAECGAKGFSDDGKCVHDARIMYEIMRYAKQFSFLLILHEEDSSFSENGLVHEGYWSNKLGLEPIPALSEELVIARDIMLAQKTGARIHITHVSSKQSVEMIREAKKQGVAITCDTTPHHVFFNHSCLQTFDTNFKVKPPIRGAKDQAALIEGLKDGTIDALATDHAPHLFQEKNTTFASAQFGAIGLETAFQAAYTKLCLKEGMDLGQLLALMTAGPSHILGLDTMAIKEGKKANLALIDTKIEKRVEKKFFSKSINCPFIGQTLASEVVCTINNGKLPYMRECDRY